MGSKVTVLPVPVGGQAGREDQAPGPLAAEVKRLRAENAVLRERLAAVQAIALEREDRIEDLRHALRMLPSVWAEKLEERLGPRKDEAGEPSQRPAPSPVAEPPPPESSAAPPPQAPAVPSSSSPSAPDLAAVAPRAATVPHAEEQDRRERALLEEVAALRTRLERRRLEVEREMLEQERRGLAADIEWTRGWRRSRRVRPAAP
jgi:hypothetical protein